MPSPCVKSCNYDDARDLCGGCGRTLDEIENWWNLSEDEQLAIMAKLAARLARTPAS